MATPFPFVAGAVLEAAELNAITELPINNQTASYILVAGDAGKRVIMNAAGATTITVNNSLFAAGQMVFIANKGAGTTTVTAGAGVTVNVNGSLAVTQYGGGTLLALSASSFVFFPGSVKNTLDVDFLLVGGGGGGGSQNLGGGSGGGGGGGGFVTGSGIIGKDTYTIKIGAGGVGTTVGNPQNGTASSFVNSANGGGGGSSLYDGLNGASGGGGRGSSVGVGGTGISGEGNAGGAGGTGTGAGGGGGAGSTGSAGVVNTGGAGGSASTNSYTGSSISYSGGGGGGGTTGGTGGTNAGNGGSGVAGTSATVNRGGGGGGGGASAAGGNGGSGRVVVRWLTADAAGLSISVTGTTTNGTDGSYTWYAWDGTGTLVVA